MLHSQLSPLHDLISTLNEAIDWLDFMSSDIVFQRILPLKTIEFNPF